jgi:DNA polymerase-3 subunit beta
MRFHAERNDFADAVAQVARSLPGRPATPILGGIKLAIVDNVLTLSGFDYETSTKTTIRVDAEADGAVLVSGRLLAEVCKVLPRKPVEVCIEAASLVVLAGSARYSLPIMPVEDYPELPEFPSVAGTVAAEEFTAAVSQVALALTRDDAQPVLTGIRVETTQDTLTLVATDRYRLALREVSWVPEAPEPLVALVPGRTMVEASRVPDTGAVELCLTESLFGITRVGWETTTRVLDAQFPPYRKLIPESFVTTARVNAQDFVAAVKRVAVVSGIQVVCEFDGDAVSMTATGELGTATEVVDAQIEGPPVTIGFNPGYLIDGVSVAKTPGVVLSMNAPNRPMVITGVDGDGEPVPGWLYLLMPVKLAKP